MVYVTSDLHGYPLEKFQALLRKAGFTERDFCFVLGDVIDRGAEGVKLLEWLMMQPNMELICGNHEYMLLAASFLFANGWKGSLEGTTEEQKEFLQAWIDNGGGPTILELLDREEETVAMILEYIQDAPLYDSVSVKDRDFLLVHGGLGNFAPDKAMEDYTYQEILWARPELHTQYFTDIMTVFGHTPTVNYGREYEGKAIATPTWINIDTGAGWGGAPMLLRLDDMQEFYADDS